MSVSELATKGARLTVTETLSVQTPHTGVAMLQLNRPERLNAINDVMVGELNKTLAALAADSSVNAVVMTGATSARESRRRLLPRSTACVSRR